MSIEPNIQAVVSAAIMKYNLQLSASYRKKSNYMSAAVVNNTERSFVVKHYDPNHGEWKTEPAARIQGSNEIYMSYINQEQDEATIARFMSYFEANKKTFNSTTFIAGDGTGMGFEAVIMLVAADDDNIQIPILIRKIPGGDHGVGVGTSDVPGGFYHTNDSDWIMNHIKKVYTTNCKFSEKDPFTINRAGLFNIEVSAPSSAVEIKIEAESLPDVENFPSPQIVSSEPNKWEKHEFARFQSFWKGFKESRVKGIDDKFKDYEVTGDLYKMKNPFTETKVFDNVKFNTNWVAPTRGYVMLYCPANIVWKECMKIALVPKDYTIQLPFWSKSLLCFSHSVGGIKYDEITDELVKSKNLRQKMKLASILRQPATSFKLFEEGTEELELYNILSQELSGFKNVTDIRDQYTNMNITDWSVKEMKLVALGIKRKESNMLSKFSDKIWDDVTNTLSKELADVEAIRNLFVTLDDLDDKLEEQRHNDMDHCLAMMNLARNQRFKYSPPEDDSSIPFSFDAGGVFGIAASIAGGLGAIEIGSKATNDGLNVISNVFWLFSTIAGAYEEEQEAVEEFDDKGNYTYLDAEKFVDKSLRQAKANSNLQKSILADPEKLKIVSELITTDFRIDVGQTAIIAENMRVANRLRFYEMLMPSKFCIRYQKKDWPLALPYRTQFTDEGGNKFWVSLLGATPKEGAIAGSDLLQEFQTERSTDGPGLGISIEDFMHRRGFWYSILGKYGKDLVI